MRAPEPRVATCRRKAGADRRWRNLEPDQAQRVFDAFAMGTKQPARFQAERNVAPNRPPWIKRGVLKNDDARRIGPLDRLALCEQGAGARKVEPRDQPQQSRLAAPARPQDGDELAAARRCRLMRSNTGSGWPSSSKRWLTSRIVSVVRAPDFRSRFDGQRSYHRTRPFCQDSSRSRRRNSRVISPEHKNAMISSAAYILA